MNIDVSFNNEERRQTERRSVNVNRRLTERRKATDRAETLQQPQTKINLAVEIFLFILAAVLGIGVLLLSGLFSGASSITTQAILTVVIVLAYMIALRRAYYF